MSLARQVAACLRNSSLSGSQWIHVCVRESKREEERMCERVCVKESPATIIAH